MGIAASQLLIEIFDLKNLNDLDLIVKLWNIEIDLDSKSIKGRYMFAFHLKNVSGIVTPAISTKKTKKKIDLRKSRLDLNQLDLEV